MLNLCHHVVLVFPCCICVVFTGHVWGIYKDFTCIYRVLLILFWYFLELFCVNLLEAKLLGVKFFGGHIFLGVTFVGGKKCWGSTFSGGPKF